MNTRTLHGALSLPLNLTRHIVPCTVCLVVYDTTLLENNRVKLRWLPTAAGYHACSIIMRRAPRHVHCAYTTYRNYLGILLLSGRSSAESVFGIPGASRFVCARLAANSNINPSWSEVVANAANKADCPVRVTRLHSAIQSGFFSCRFALGGGGS
jgi:hypothetical protein